MIINREKEMKEAKKRWQKVGVKKRQKFVVVIAETR